MSNNWFQRTALRAAAEPEAKPRVEPVSQDAWDKSFSTGMPDLDHPESHEH